MAEISNAAHAGETGNAVLRAAATPHGRAGLAPLANFSIPDWRELAVSAVEPNAYYLPDWEAAIDALARDRSNVQALAARSDARKLLAMLPAISAWRAFKFPLPVLVSADPYGDLGIPLIDGHAPPAAARALLNAARENGIRAIVLRHVTLEGAAMQAISAVLADDGLAPHVLRAETRACLDATKGADELLHAALGAKKLKELRRQRNRLAEHGPVTFQVATTPAEVTRAIEVFLALEASGWKGQRGTALMQHAGDAAFMRRATAAMAARGECEIVMLKAGETPVAAGVVLRHNDAAFWFKLGVDETFAKYSPGVQLALELTRQLCADARIASADSTALPGHPMIEPIWRGRLPIGDVVVPLKRNDPVVALLVFGLGARAALRARLRQAVRALRKLREKRQ